MIDSRENASIGEIFRRAGDIVCCSVLLLFLGIFVFIPISLLIWRDSPGKPVLFRQRRIGKGEKVFLMWKFRSMKETRYPFDPDLDLDPNDPRLTRVGRIIRTVRIDELPQLINVFVGDMTFFGPRPDEENTYFDRALIRRWYRTRTRVKPGITGFAQRSGREINVVGASPKKVNELLWLRVKRDRYQMRYQNRFGFNFIVGCKTFLMLSRCGGNCIVAAFFPSGPQPKEERRADLAAQPAE